VALPGTNQEFGRPYNRRIVLEAIRLHAPITRAQIARRVGLTVQPVSARLNRAMPRLILSDGGQNAVMRGAAALMVSGALSPRFGQMFTKDMSRADKDAFLAAPNKKRAA
jgi:hypothetical protein